VAGDPGVSDAIPLGFDFEFYAGTYDAVYISTSGAVGFDRASLIGESSTRYVPSREAPNKSSCRGIGSDRRAQLLPHQ
jgi:hypothetical protein